MRGQENETIPRKQRRGIFCALPGVTVCGAGVITLRRGMLCAGFRYANVFGAGLAGGNGV